MDDEQLRLAIAEELGHKRCACGRFHIYGTISGSSDFPNWPGDIAAAMGLLTESKYHYQISPSCLTIHLGEGGMGAMIIRPHDNTPKGIARAISEAAYSALTARS